MDRTRLVVLLVVLALIIGALAVYSAGRRDNSPQPSESPVTKIESPEDLKNAKKDVDKTDVDSVNRDAEENAKEADSL